MSLLIRKTNRVDSCASPPAGASDFFLALDPIFIGSSGLTEGDQIDGKIKEVIIPEGKLADLEGEDISFIIGPIPSIVYISEKSWKSLFGEKDLDEWDITLTAELKGI